MKITTRWIPWTLGLVGLLALGVAPAFAADESALATELTEATVAATEATPAADPTQPALESAVIWDPKGDCALWCGGGQYWYYYVTRSECCSGTLTCPDGSNPGIYAFYPYQGFAEICTI